MFAVLHIADFPLHAVLRATSDAVAGAPAALFAGTSKKSVVLAANATARAAGVELGMSAPQAVARCPQLVIRSPLAAAETEARAALLAVGFTLSPTIEDTAPGICTADLKGAEAAKIISLAKAAVAELGAVGLPATAGIAATPLLALYAARVAGGPRPEDSGQKTEHGKQIAPPPSVLRSPPSVLSPPSSVLRPPSSVLHVTDPTPFLAPLPLATADPSPELAVVLANWGLRTLGDLTALPRDEIVRRFGAEGLALWQRAAGGSPRPLHPVAPPREFAARLEFEDAVETLEPLLFILRRFLDRLALELRASQHVAAEVELMLQLEDETAHARSFRLPEPTADVEILFRTLHTHLESLTTAASIVAVALRLTPTRPLVRQQGLFETGLRDPHGFAETLARVSALVGADRVGTPQLEDTHRPDAVRLVTPPAVVPSSPAAAPPAGSGSVGPLEGVHPPLGPPLRRFRPPVPVQLSAADDGTTYLWSPERQGEIAFRSAVYPVSGDWWQKDRTWQRLESDIALAEGGLYRLIQIGNEYFLEGEYD
jgi:protein ImuB